MDVFEKTILKMFHMKDLERVINELLRIYYEKIY